MAKQDEILKLLRELNQKLWIGNYDERMGELGKRIKNEEASNDEQDKRWKAIESYLGVTFDDKYKYIKK